MPWTQVGEDTFTDTGGTDLGDHTPNQGAGWTPIIDAFEINVAGTGLATTGVALARFDPVAALANDQAMEIKIGANGDEGNFAISCRMTGTNPAFTDISGYWMQRDDVADTVTLYRVTNGSFTAIDGPDADGSPVGAVYRIEVVGTAITVKKNGATILSATDGNHASGNCYIYASITLPTIYDDFFAYEFTADEGGFLLVKN